MENTAKIVPLTTGQSFSFNEVSNLYMMQYKGRDASFSSRLSFFVERMGHLPIGSIDADAIDDALDALRQRGKLHHGAGARRGESLPSGKPLSGASLNRYRATAQAVLTWASKQRNIRKCLPRDWQNPVRLTQREAEGNGRTRYLTPEEYRNLQSACRLSAWPRLGLLVRLAVTTGARRGALMGLRWCDVDLDAGRAAVGRTKNGSQFVLALLPEVVTELRRFAPRQPNDELVFCGRSPFKPMNFSKAYSNALARAGIEGACFHSLRHTHASWLAQSGAELLQIAESLNHKSLAMTKRYSHLCVASREKMLSQVFG